MCLCLIIFMIKMRKLQYLTREIYQYAKWAQLFADAWAESRREAAPVVEDAPQWDMLSARVAQSEYDD